MRRLSATDCLSLYMFDCVTKKANSFSLI